MPGFIIVRTEAATRDVSVRKGVIRNFIKSTDVFLRIL